MEFLIFWIATLIISCGISFSTVLQLVKDAADNGYIVNSDTIGSSVDVNNEMRPEIIMLLVPVINIMQSMDIFVKYDSNKSRIMDILGIEGSLEEMTDDELESYKKNPTKFNAFILGFKRTLFEENGSITDTISDSNTNNDNTNLDNLKNNSLNNRDKIEELTKAKEELLSTDNKKNNIKTKSLKNNKK